MKHKLTSQPLLGHEIIICATTRLTPLVHNHNKGYVQKMVVRYVEFLNQRALHHGPQSACDFAKQFANIVKRRALGLEVSYAYPFSVSCHQDCIPRRLSCFRRFIYSGSPVLKGVAISISNLYRVASLKPEVSYKSILSPYKGKGPRDLQGLLYYLKGFGKLLSGKVETDIGTEKPYASDKAILSASPSSEQSLYGAHNDALRLSHKHSRLQALATFSLYESSNRKGAAQELTFLMQEMVQDLDRFLPLEKVGLGKYEFIPDKGGKTRGITLANYFIQDSLSHLHDSLMRVLSKIPQDFTYKQNEVAEYVKLQMDLGYKGFCFDMSSATDRFPLWIQSNLLSRIYGSKVAGSWVRLMKLGLSHRHNTLHFAVGQPMGLLSSFPAFALSHHAIVRYAAYLAREEPRYMILGDDIVIFREKTAKFYSNICLDIGVDISPTKSILSTDKINVVEFCKKLFLNGREVTGIGIGLLVPVSFDLTELISVSETIVSWYGGSYTVNPLLQNFTTRFLNRNLPRSLHKACLAYSLTKYSVSQTLSKVWYQMTGLSTQDIAILGEAYAQAELNRLLTRYRGFDQLCDKYYYAIKRKVKSLTAGYLHVAAHVLQYKLDEFIWSYEEAVKPQAQCNAIVNLEMWRHVSTMEQAFVGTLQGRSTSAVCIYERERRETVQRIHKFKQTMAYFIS